jgi:hypothetical protein
MVSMYSELSAEEKFRKCASLFQSAKRIAYSSVRHQHPELTGIELDLKVFRKMYKNELSEKFFVNFENYFRKLQPK